MLGVVGENLVKFLAKKLCWSTRQFEQLLGDVKREPMEKPTERGCCLWMPLVWIIASEEVATVTCHSNVCPLIQQFVLFSLLCIDMWLIWPTNTPKWRLPWDPSVVSVGIINHLLGQAIHSSSSFHVDGTTTRPKLCLKSKVKHPSHARTLHRAHCVRYCTRWKRKASLIRCYTTMR